MACRNVLHNSQISTFWLSGGTQSQLYILVVLLMEEILHQLRLVVYPIIYDRFYTSQVVIAGFLPSTVVGHQKSCAFADFDRPSKVVSVRFFCWWMAVTSDFCLADQRLEKVSVCNIVAIITPRVPCRVHWRLSIISAKCVPKPSTQKIPRPLISL